MNKYIRILKGLSWSAIHHGVDKRSIDELEYAACHTLGQIERIHSRELRSIPAIWPDRMMDHQLNICLRLQKYEDGMMPVEDLLVLLYLLAREQPSIVLEIGTYLGHTTRAIAENAVNSVVHTLDLPAEYDSSTDTISIPKDDFHLIAKRQVGREFSGQACADRIRQHFGDSATWDFKKAQGAKFFFIDGSHTYEYIKNDTQKCFELCTGGETFLWHDIDDRHPGVIKYLVELRKSGKDIIRFANTQLAYLKY